jgi:hypothetical protein
MSKRRRGILYAVGIDILLTLQAVRGIKHRSRTTVPSLHIISHIAHRHHPIPCCAPLYHPIPPIPNVCPLQTPRVRLEPSKLPRNTRIQSPCHQRKTPSSRVNRSFLVITGYATAYNVSIDKQVAIKQAITTSSTS